MNDRDLNSILKVLYENGDTSATIITEDGREILIKDIKEIRRTKISMDLIHACSKYSIHKASWTLKSVMNMYCKKDWDDSTTPPMRSGMSRMVYRYIIGMDQPNITVVSMDGHTEMIDGGEWIDAMHRFVCGRPIKVTIDREPHVIRIGDLSEMLRWSIMNTENIIVKSITQKGGTDEAEFMNQIRSIVKLGRDV